MCCVIRKSSWPEAWPQALIAASSLRLRYCATGVAGAVDTGATGAG